jgi:cyanate permease
LSIIPNFSGKRWLKISLRTVHLIGFAGVFASILTRTEQDVYWAITIVTGLGLIYPLHLNMLVSGNLSDS